MHETYLPFPAKVLKAHFAEVRGGGDDGRHLKYYRDSIERAKRLQIDLAAGKSPTPAEIRLGRQMEKDERFWVVGALMALYHDGARARRFGSLMERAGLSAPADFPDWAAALSGPLDLFFEANLASPRGYRDWLREHLDERVPIPYLRESARRPRARLEGQTHADAILIASAHEVAVIFEAKVLSDVSAHITFDVARNQLARTIDVMLETPKASSPLSCRKPELTYLVLLTPALLKDEGTGNACGRSRLYGWLMPEYQNRDSPLLHRHLPHRDEHDLAAAATRLGWATWEDCNAVVPGACGWLTATSTTRDGSGTCPGIHRKV
jgi:hypothetical protein